MRAAERRRQSGGGGCMHDGCCCRGVAHTHWPRARAAAAASGATNVAGGQRVGDGGGGTSPQRPACGGAKHSSGQLGSAFPGVLLPTQPPSAPSTPPRPSRTSVLICRARASRRSAASTVAMASLRVAGKAPPSSYQSPHRCRAALLAGAHCGWDDDRAGLPPHPLSQRPWPEPGEGTSR